MQKYATRLNSFASGAAEYWPDQSGSPTITQMVARAATAEGLTDLDLNYPDHVAPGLDAVGQAVKDGGLTVSGMAVRYYSLPAFKAGAFTNPDKSVRQAAIDLTKQGIAVLRYDDRGFGESTGVHSEATTYDFATDAIGALNYLKTRLDVHSDEIGIIGHSVDLSYNYTLYISNGIY